MSIANYPSPPRSLCSTTQACIRIINLTNRCVDIIWINFTGEYVRYQKLSKREFMDINTFVTHPWIAIDSKTKARLHIDKRFVYMPQRWGEYMENRFPGRISSLPAALCRSRIIAPVTLPVHSLRFRTMLEVCSYLKDGEDAEALGLPQQLTLDLRKIIRERETIPLFNVE